MIVVYVYRVRFSFQYHELHKNSQGSQGGSEIPDSRPLLIDINL